MTQEGPAVRAQIRALVLGRIRLSFDSAHQNARVRGICTDEPTEPWVAQKRSNLDSAVLKVISR